MLNQVVVFALLGVVAYGWKDPSFVLGTVVGGLIMFILLISVTSRTVVQKPGIFKALYEIDRVKLSGPEAVGETMRVLREVLSIITSG